MRGVTGPLALAAPSGSVQPYSSKSLRCSTRRRETRTWTPFLFVPWGWGFSRVGMRRREGERKIDGVDEEDGIGMRGRRRGGMESSR